MSCPLVSIIVNVYNGERYVAECLDSILNLEGSYTCRVLVVDDCSVDRTSEVVARYAGRGIEYIRLSRNMGAAAAIGQAFSLVDTQYVARIDYDDRYRPNFLSESLAALTRNPEAAFVCAGVMMIDTDGRPSRTTGPADHGEEVGCRDCFRSMLTRHFVTAPTILGRTEHWKQAMPIPDGMNFCDWYMNLVMAEAAPVVVLDSITADYRIHLQGMHHTSVRSGLGERVTFDVLDRFLNRSSRTLELKPHARRITAMHYADWGNKYFGENMNVDAARCYRAAVRLDPVWSVRAGLLHRLAGATLGRKYYEGAKLAARRVL